ncbi:MAG: insulinase family protein, partial [bacterium]|nr:insulinase family protein [bacterium]
MAKDNIFNNFKKIELKNGFKIYYLVDKTHPVFSLQVYSLTGSVYEPIDLRGMSHFLEHMLFKGSKNLKTGDVARIIEGSGCIMNAGTSYDYTVYWVDGPKEAFD